MFISLIQNFKNLDTLTKETLADICSPLKLALMVLQISYDKFGVEYLSAEGIVACLEATDIAVKTVAISKSLSPAGNKVNRKVQYKETKYKITIHGRRYISDLGPSEGLNVVYVESNTPRTARKQLKAFLSELSGTVRICDPYYGTRTLDVLEMIPKTCRVLFLTSKTNEKHFQINNLITDFITEHPQTEFRSLVGSKDLHDRFILCDSFLMIIGHGIKDIGNKDSFVIKLEKRMIQDMWNHVKNDFDSKWSSGQPLL